MKNIIILFILLTADFFSAAQTDSVTQNSVKYSPGFKFKDGIYLNYYQFKNNSPLTKNRILTETDINRIDFFDIILEQENIKYFETNGEIVEIPTDKIWGFSNRSVVFINYNGEFNRIPVLGRISHFISNYTYAEYDPYSNQAYQYGYGYRATPIYRTELRQYVIDYESGKIFDFNYKIIESLIISDNKLYDEFVNLSTRKKKKQMFIYLRKFNENNPIYFNVN